MNEIHVFKLCVYMETKYFLLHCCIIIITAVFVTNVFVLLFVIYFFVLI